MGKDWSTCPVRAALNDPYVQAVAQLEAGSKLAPVTDWPHGFAHWVQPMWSTLRELMADRQAHAMQQASGGSNGG